MSQMLCQVLEVKWNLQSSKNCKAGIKTTEIRGKLQKYTQLWFHFPLECLNLICINVLLHNSAAWLAASLTFANQSTVTDTTVHKLCVVQTPWFLSHCCNWTRQAERLGGHPNTSSFEVVADRSPVLFPRWLKVNPESCLHSHLLGKENRAWPLSVGGFVIKARIWLATLPLLILWIKLTQEAPC